MKTLRSVSVDDFIEWYLRRELAKGNIHSVAETRFERHAQMEATQRGKLWPGYISWSWSLVEISPIDLPNLLILGSDWTRDERLVRNQVLRTLDAAVAHALESGYFTTQTDPRIRHQSYYNAYERSAPSTSELDRVVLRTLRDDERLAVAKAERDDVSYYLRVRSLFALPRFASTKASRACHDRSVSRQCGLTMARHHAAALLAPTNSEYRVS